MGIVLFVAFVAVPLVEITVFIQVGGWLGTWPTVAAVVLTAMAGTTMLRLQGLGVLMRAQQSLAANRLPVAEVFDGLCLVVAGALLLTPGFVTDGAGLVLFVPSVRALLRRTVGRRLKAAAEAAGRRPSAAWPGGGVTIDGEYSEAPSEATDTDDERTPPAIPPPP